MSGPAGGGNLVLIVGSGLANASSVTFGGTPASILFQDPIGLLIIVTAPAHAAGTVPVVVTNAGGTSAPAMYTYLAPVGPVVLSLLPTSGPTTGGTPFTIVGSNLAGASVTFNGVAATGVVVDPTGTIVTGVTPAGTAGNVPVVVTTPAGSATVAGGFTYVAPPPPVAVSLVPVTGPTTGGTPFVLVGSNLAGASVTFNGVAATGVVVDPSGTIVTGVTPAGTAGNVPVVVTTPAGSATVAGGFTYVAAPPVAVSLLPTSGSSAGGTLFTITGSNLAGASVTFNGVAATGVVVDPSGTIVTGVTPAGTVGNVPVVVTTPGGSTTVAGGFNYV
ncbi:cell surface receptor IPT/TIG domain-containing protein [Streptomyces malaysiense]|uniref:Cell surface receptor IPT/TIG domain-containing protein n=2 Tax=Streptomyces malaysiense TaxID=1428626 RepID=A0A1J4PTT2_9ACTN|nr:cell surface receptor IPT/TIG domain-containing protein [Streptomyces malaysiense]